MNELLDFTWNYLILSTVENHSIVDTGLIHYLEKEFLERIVDYIGYEWAVRVEDFIILFTTVLFTLGLAFFIITPLILKGPFVYTIRFSDKLKGVVYVFAEHQGVKELILKKPKNLWERIELALALMYVGFRGESRPVKTGNLRTVGIICFVVFIILLILFILSVLFTINVVQYGDIGA